MMLQDKPECAGWVLAPGGGCSLKAAVNVSALVEREGYSVGLVGESSTRGGSCPGKGDCWGGQGTDDLYKEATD